MNIDVEDFLSNEPVKIVVNEITIDDEIKNRLWKLNDTEQENLKQSLINEGCREALILWGNILIDGHNRYEICKAFDIEYRTIQKHFNNKNEVLKWIDTNQLSRRNLTDFQRTILNGRISKINKQENNGIRGNQYTKEAGDKMSQGKISEDLKITARTLQRAENFVDAIEDIERNVGKELSNKITNQETTLTKQDVISLGKEEPFKQEELIKMIINKEVKNLKEAKKVMEIDNRKLNTTTDKVENLYLGDCIEILKTLKEKSVDCVVMDPPYLIDYKDTRESFNPTFNDSSENKEEKLDNWFREIKRVIKDNAHIYCFYGQDENNSFYKYLNKYFDPQIMPLIWVKNNHTMTDFNENYASKYEPLYFCSNGDRLLNNKVSPNVLNYNIPTNKLHKTQKPIDLLEYLISNSTVEGEIVLDPFMGSGSTLRAAKNLKRKYVGIEIEPDIYNIAVERLKN